MPHRRHRQAFSLIEVMVSLAILLASLAILVQIEAQAMNMTQEAQRMVTATELAQQKMSEAQEEVEKTGFTDSDVCENGDFSDFDDETMNLEFGNSLANFHYEWCVQQIDLQLAGDIAGMAQGLAGSGILPPQSPSAASAAAQLPGASAGAAGLPDLSMLGMSPDMIGQMLSGYIREIRVIVWWGDDEEDAVDKGNAVVLSTDVINPTGAVIATQTQDPTGGGQ